LNCEIENRLKLGYIHEAGFSPGGRAKVVEHQDAA
jgi:hypothetical protein